MASIRRTLSPARHHRDRFSASSPPSSPLRSASGTLRHSHHAAAPSPWRRPSFRILLFFFLGFFLGFFPPADVADSALRPHHFSLRRDRKLEFDVVRSKSHLSAELSEKSSPAGARSADPGNSRKLLLIVTPTCGRTMQAHHLHRLAHTLRLVPPPLLWIVVEAGAASAETADILRRTGVAYRHILWESGSSEVRDRAVYQRNAALDHIEHHRLEGIVYFADEDNVYSLELFDRLREIRNFGTWPVAMLGQNKMTLEGSVCNGSRVIGWYTNEKSKRLSRFHVDLSGFAFNSTMLWDPKKRVHQSWNAIRLLDTVEEGFQGTTFVEQLVEDETQMEGIPADCSKIMNWHLHPESTDTTVYPKGGQFSRNLDVVVPLK